jgi:UDP-N-acetylglucosamine transferase subunit ALG13
MRIFVAVGTQLPFDRLVRAVDAWAGDHPDIADLDVFAQIGPGEYVPEHVSSASFLPPREFEARTRAADLLVTHAGTGCILAALEQKRPIVVMPRRALLGEHRNDHQLATAERFCTVRGVTVAWDEEDLRRQLERYERIEAPAAELPPHARPDLLRALSDFINDAPPPRGRSRVRKLLRSLWL